MTQLETLQIIQKRLADTPAVQIIKELRPRTRQDALSWAKRLPSWDEYCFSKQVIGLARTHQPASNA